MLDAFRVIPVLVMAVLLADLLMSTAFRLLDMFYGNRRRETVTSQSHGLDLQAQSHPPH